MLQDNLLIDPPYLNNVARSLHSAFLRCVRATPLAASTARPIARNILVPGLEHHISWTPYAVIMTLPTLKERIL